MYGIEILAVKSACRYFVRDFHTRPRHIGKPKINSFKTVKSKNTPYANGISNYDNLPKEKMNIFLDET